MTVPNIVTDPFLNSVLDVSTLTRDQCLALFNLAETYPLANSGAPPPPSRESQQNSIKQHKLLNAYISQLRGLNREAILQVRQAKQATAEARQEVDRLHLQLQNLYYEQRHLRAEITACETYDHKYRQLPLIAVEEFLRQHPEHEGNDENALMVARINQEYTEREALEQVRQGLLKKKQGLIADNKKRREDLANLDRDLEKFIDVSTWLIPTAPPYMANLDFMKLILIFLIKAAKPIQKLFEKDQ
ncbi:MAG: hypothetical protein M1816_002973 [Peltula sp. TS41687]|nr:MAG: hypothetical protein M1816_002973 [Peltula sp. TS41687]